MKPDRFIILREELDGYSTRGPMARALSIEEATAEVKRLTAQYRGQRFKIFAEVGSAVLVEAVGVHLHAPDLSMPAPDGTVPMKVPHK